MDWLKSIAPTITSALGGPLAGLAVDAVSKAIRVPGMSPNEVCKAIYESDLGYDQLIKEFVTPTGGGWTHVSIPNTPVALARGQALVIDRLGTRAFA